MHRALSTIRNNGVYAFQGELYTGSIGPIVGTLESVRIIEVSAFQGCPQGGVPLYVIICTYECENTCLILGLNQAHCTFATNHVYICLILQIMKFGQLKLNPSLWFRDQYTTVSNAVHINEDVYLSFDQKQPNYLQKLTRVPKDKLQKETFTPLLPWPVSNFGLASFKGSFLFVGGKFTSANKPAGAGTYSNKVFTYSPETKKFQVTLPPMRVACALPTVVTHEGLIIVIRGEGGDSGVEVLDTTSPNLEWKEAEPLPYYSATASATVVAGYLVVWIGAVYCMHLSCITAPTKSTQYLHSSWFALPSPPESVSLRLANYMGCLAAFAIDKDYSKVYLYIFDHKSKQWINLQEIGNVCVPSSNRSSTLPISASVTGRSVLVVWECYRETYDGGFLVSYGKGLAIQTGAIQNASDD